MTLPADPIWRPTELIVGAVWPACPSAEVIVISKPAIAKTCASVAFIHSRSPESLNVPCGSFDLELVWVRAHVVPLLCIFLAPGDVHTPSIGVLSICCLTFPPLPCRSRANQSPRRLLVAKELVRLLLDCC